MRRDAPRAAAMLEKLQAPLYPATWRGASRAITRCLPCASPHAGSFPHLCWTGLWTDCGKHAEKHA